MIYKLIINYIVIFTASSFIFGFFILNNIIYYSFTDIFKTIIVIILSSIILVTVYYLNLFTASLVSQTHGRRGQ